MDSTSNGTTTFAASSIDQNVNVFANLMVISTSLALGLIVGFTVVQAAAKFYALARNAMKRCRFFCCSCSCCVGHSSYGVRDSPDFSRTKKEEKELELKKDKQKMHESLFEGMFTAERDDSSDNDPLEELLLHNARNDELVPSRRKLSLKMFEDLHEEPDVEIDEQLREMLRKNSF